MPRKANNKTSYVMNLITNGEEEQGQESQSEQKLQSEQGTQNDQSGRTVQAAAQSVTAAQASAPGVSPEAELKKVVVVDEDQESERLSEEIRGQLELQLEQELKEQADGQSAEPVTARTEPEVKQLQPQPQPSQEMGQSPLVTETAKQEAAETAGTEAAVKDTAVTDTETTNTEIVEPTMDTEMNTATETVDTAADATAAAENTAADMAAAAEAMDMAATAEISNTTTQPTQPSQPGYRMVNVMETLVARVDLDKYIKEYDVCPCPRCRADVHALILTTLPSKYVVMDEAAISPMLNFYESRRKTDIFTATLKACLEVKEHPRHDGEAGQ